MNADNLTWDSVTGLIPVVVQDYLTLQVLMHAYMNREALEKTQETMLVTFFSRKRQSLWTKGETSGNFLNLISIASDCDGDTLLIQAAPKGPTCHRNTTSCFSSAFFCDVGFLAKLEYTIAQRFLDRPRGSYTTQLIEEGMDRIVQKVGEEAIEVVIAAKNEDQGKFLGEVSDLIFHILVLLRARSESLTDVIKVLRSRHKG
jgi:phosphoribosyl-AMP cyclohydrolase / phosphoribosyl-ATP pyrophosphohydrolase